jgi:hypothetical protein
MNGVTVGIAKYIKILPKIEIKNALLLRSTLLYSL